MSDLEPSQSEATETDQPQNVNVVKAIARVLHRYDFNQREKTDAELPESDGEGELRDRVMADWKEKRPDYLKRARKVKARLEQLGLEMDAKKPVED